MNVLYRCGVLQNMQFNFECSIISPGFPLLPENVLRCPKSGRTAAFVPLPPLRGVILAKFKNDKSFDFGNLGDSKPVRASSESLNVLRVVKIGQILPNYNDMS